MRRFSAAYFAAVGSLFAGVLALVSAFPATALPASSSHPSGYLALGDSLVFGYNPLVVKPGVDPSRFVGYPELVSTRFTSS